MFPAKKASKFREWLDCSTLELKPTSITMEIMSYLAYETVAQVTWWMRVCVRVRWTTFQWNISLSQDCGFVSVGEARNDCDDKCHQSCDLFQPHPLQHSYWGTHTHTCNNLIFACFEQPKLRYELRLSREIRCFQSFQVKKDPDSPEATPPSTPGSSHSRPLPQGNGSLDGRARQRKRKKVRVSI